MTSNVQDPLFVYNKPIGPLWGVLPVCKLLIGCCNCNILCFVDVKYLLAVKSPIGCWAYWRPLLAVGLLSVVTKADGSINRLTVKYEFICNFVNFKYVSCYHR